MKKVEKNRFVAKVFGEMHFAGDAERIVLQHFAPQKSDALAGKETVARIRIETAKKEAFCNLTPSRLRQ